MGSWTSRLLCCIEWKCCCCYSVLWSTKRRTDSLLQDTMDDSSPLVLPLRGSIPNSYCPECSSDEKTFSPGHRRSLFLDNRLCNCSKDPSSINIHKHKTRWKPGLSIDRFNIFGSSSLLVLLALVVAVFPAGVLGSGTSSSSSSSSSSNSFDIWENEITLDSRGPNRNFVVQWTPSDDRIVFRVTARTRGYIGFGFNVEPKMDGADIVVGWV